jgi:hypothetical protein
MKINLVRVNAGKPGDVQIIELCTNLLLHYIKLVWMKSFFNYTTK